ncbi:hypothetical protein [Streptomyces sp. NPDC008125]|uniref:hypothetical protein n=1 Tax=Streptomyces sp. NPDC008125 TaxID=3364811 RepID=UPI0036EBEF7B
MENDNTDDGAPVGRPDRPPLERQPWSPEQGPPPRVTAYPAGRRPGMYVWNGTTWVHCSVEARHDWPDGEITYMVSGPLAGAPGHIVIRTYVWPHGLRPVPQHTAPPPAPPEARREAEAEGDTQDEDESEGGDTSGE